MDKVSLKITKGPSNTDSPLRSFTPKLEVGGQKVSGTPLGRLVCSVAAMKRSCMGIFVRPGVACANLEYQSAMAFCSPGR